MDVARAMAPRKEKVVERKGKALKVESDVVAKMVRAKAKPIRARTRTAARASSISARILAMATMVAKPLARTRTLSAMTMSARPLARASTIVVVVVGCGCRIEWINNGDYILLSYDITLAL